MSYKLKNPSLALLAALQKLMSGDLTGHKTPKKIWESDAPFHVQILPKLLAYYHAISKELGMLPNMSTGLFAFLNLYFKNFD